MKTLLFIIGVLCCIYALICNYYDHRNDTKKYYKLKLIASTMACVFWSVIIILEFY